MIDKKTDETVLEFGIHKGKKITNVPPSWLLRYADKVTGIKDADLLAYIEDNRMILLQECDLKTLKKNR